MKILILSTIVLGIFIFEMNYSPNLEKKQFEEYSEEAIFLERQGIPKELLVFYRIDNDKKVKNLIKKYPNLRGKPLKIWINNLNLSKRQLREIALYRIFYEQRITKD